MEEADRLKEFLLEIHMNAGKVCPEFETCTHEACRSSVMTWVLADAALQGSTMEQMRHEQAQVKLAAQEQALSLTVQCFNPRCASIIVIPAPPPGQHPICKKCGAKDVVVLDDDRCPDGTLNNCALAGSYEESMCQICDRGPCPEAARFSSWTPPTPRSTEDPFDPSGVLRLDTSHLKKKKRR